MLSTVQHSSKIWANVKLPKPVLKGANLEKNHLTLSTLPK